MKYIVISSGSKGNATLISEQETLILIDMGIPLKRLNEALGNINKSVMDIDAVLVTHAHTDHISGLKFFSPKKIYAPINTLPGSLFNTLEFDKVYNFKDLTIEAVKVSHDANNPASYIIRGEKEKLVLITDTGIVPLVNIDKYKNPTYLLIESNHDVQLELQSNRSAKTKQRVLSEKGHLCNEESAFASSMIIGDKTKEITLLHLSQECNNETLAMSSYTNVLNYKGIDLNRFKLRCAKQEECVIGGNNDEN